MNKYTLMIIIIATFNACHNVKFEELKNFPSEEILSGHVVQKDYFFGTAKVFILNDTVALFKAPYHHERAFYFVNTNDFSLVNIGGVIGRGPGELINAGYLYIDRGVAIWLLDGMLGKILRFPIDSAIRIRDYLPNHSIGFRDYGMLVNFEIENNKISYYNGETGRSILNKVEGENRIGLGVTHAFIEDGGNELANKYDNISVNFSRFKRHPNKDVIVVAYHYDAVLVLMKSNGEIIKKIKGPDTIDPIKERQEKRYQATAYTDMRVDEDYIYCLYNGKASGSRDESDVFEFHDSGCIFIFDWEGNPIKKLVLEYGAYSFDLDKKRNRIITFSNDLVEEIVYYEYEF